MRLGDSRGMVLVLTLMVLAVIMALVVEFAYGVYVNTGFLENRLSAERLSLASASGVTLASGFITGVVGRLSYTYPSYVEMPDMDVFGDGSAKVSVRVEDENSKFNLNSIVYANNELHVAAYDAFRRLLAALSVDEKVADLIADWIDRDEAPRLADSERDAKNAPLDGPEELLLIAGIGEEVYDKLIPYVTVFGKREVLEININGAEAPLLMALDGRISPEMAGRIASRREIKPFEQTGDIVQVPGFEKELGTSLTKYITVKGGTFRILSTASDENGLKRTVECVIGPGGVVKRWKEQ